MGAKNARFALIEPKSGNEEQKRLVACSLTFSHRHDCLMVMCKGKHSPAHSCKLVIKLELKFSLSLARILSTLLRLLL